MRNWIIILLFLPFSVHLCGQMVYNLYDSAPAEDNGLWGEEQTNAKGSIWNISHANIEVYFPQKENNTGQAVLIFPGGGYRSLSWGHEGRWSAYWLRDNGITAVIVKYRLPNGHCMIPLSDALEAMRYARSHASEWGVNPRQIGVMGFSAGGHLAATLCTKYTDSITRPDFCILYYPVIRLSNHSNSKKHLIGDDATEETVDFFDAAKHVTSQTPPTLFFAASTDSVVSVARTLDYVESLVANEVYTEAHIYPQGRHGFCFKKEFPYHSQMTETLKLFMQKMLQKDEK
ncbi:MAG: alpha/beta hydrolase [Paludibacteraceae bacterium]|nr:alpha/beta hydrolase [Paludibacteraceae bacterium]